jgi:hypothetical protein
MQLYIQGLKQAHQDFVNNLRQIGNCYLEFTQTGLIMKQRQYSEHAYSKRKSSK